MGSKPGPKLIHPNHGSMSRTGSIADEVREESNKHIRESNERYAKMEHMKEFIRPTDDGRKSYSQLLEQGYARSQDSQSSGAYSESDHRNYARSGTSSAKVGSAEAKSEVSKNVPVPARNDTSRGPLPDRWGKNAQGHLCGSQTKKDPSRLY